MTFKFKFGTAVRGYCLVLGLILFWAIWASAQTATNDPPKVEKTSGLAGGLAAAREDLLTFGLHHVDFLVETKVLNQPLWKYIASLIYILLAFYSSKIIDWLISGRLKRWAVKSATRFDDLLLDAIHGPVKVVSFVIFLHVGLRVFAWPSWVEDYLSRGLKVVVAWSLTYLGLKAVDLLLLYWRERVTAVEDRSFDDQLFPILRKSIKAFIVIVAVLATSQNLGLDITSVIASLSIGGLALGLAAQDTIANLFGAVAVFMDKPFRIGDRIKLESVDGVVESIGLRSTRVRNLDGHLITVPNKTMGNATITNVTRRPNIKTEMDFGLTYDTPPEKVKRALTILEDIYRQHPMTFDVIISFNKFADSALNVLVVHWWNNTDYKAYLAGMQQMNFAIMERFAAEGIVMAYPTQTLYLKQDSDLFLQHIRKE